MNPTFRSTPAVLGAYAITFTFLLSESAWGQLVSSGYQIKNRKFEILITDYGYADLALDRRWGFKGREHLSGEWAAAVYYSGGRNPAGPIWFQPQWYFPDWVSNSDFRVEKPFGVANPAAPTNMYGFNIYQSIITNRDLRVTFRYDMVDLGTNETQRLAMGLVGKGTGGAGSNHYSDRYVFRQQYQFANISGGTLNNLKFYQLLHALEGGWAVYDDRDYGGAMPSFRYRLTQQGQSYGFDTRTMETVQHTDTLGVSFNMPPTGYEVGFYGVKGTDNHTIGKPSAGVHLSVESDTFNSKDYFNPSGTGWVSGALRFGLGSLSPGASTSITALLGIHTRYEVKYPPLDLVVRSVKPGANNTLVIDFEERTRNPLVGYLLRQSTELTPDSDPKEWDPLPLPYYNNFPLPGWKRFEAPTQPNQTKLFLFIQPQIIKD